MALIATLQDNFNDNSIDGAKWEAQGTVAEQNQCIEATSTIAGGNNGIWAAATYDLAASAVTIKIVDAGLCGSTLYGVTFYSIRIHSADWLAVLEWQIYDGDIVASIDNDWGWSMTYNATTHRYLRIRESGGTTYWDYSANGVAWINARTESNPFTMTSLHYFLGVETWDTPNPSTTTVVKIDNFNIPSFTKEFSETLTCSEVLSRASSRNFSDTMTITDPLVKGVGKVWLETMTLTETFLRGVARVFDETITLTETIGRSISRFFTDTSTLTDVFGKVRGMYITFTDSFILSEVFDKAITWMRGLHRSSTWGIRSKDGGSWSKSSLNSGSWAKRSSQETTHTRREDETSIWEKE